MDSEVVLDPLKIVGSLSVDVPLFVIDYIAIFYKVSYKEYYMSLDEYFNNIIVEIESKDKVIINNPFETIDDIDLKKIIKFISPYLSISEWSIDNILHAYQHILSFSIDNEELPQILSKDISFGTKTNNNPFAINEIIAYRIAIKNNYQMDRNTQFDEVIFFKYTCAATYTVHVCTCIHIKIKNHVKLL